jgi:hypothetical protein
LEEMCLTRSLVKAAKENKVSKYPTQKMEFFATDKIHKEIENRLIHIDTT